MSVYYNEIDPKAAAWLRQLIALGIIAYGHVDERSIEDVAPSDLKGFTQCHFFAGIGGWSYALRLARWPDTKPIWSASCPCQPYSAAGKGGGFADERHLWPAFYYLASVCQPAKIVGEQVAGSFAEPWIDLVHADVEALGYAFGCIAFPSAGVGAPHIRDRNFWLADANQSGSQGWISLSQRGDQWPVRSNGLVGRMANADMRGRQQFSLGTGIGAGIINSEDDSQKQILQLGSIRSSLDVPGPTNGHWRDADWIGCTDDKWRPVEPGSFPLADGVPGRVGLLRGYGNAINAEAARAFLEVIC